jgi:hypothetical protein
MTATDVLSAAIGAVFGVGVGIGDEHDGDDAPLAAAEVDNGGTIAVRGKAWPRESAARVALLTGAITTAEREESVKIAQLKAAVSNACELRDARLKELHSVDQAARAQIRVEIVAELRPKVEAAWRTYRQSATLEDAKALGAVLVSGAEREAHELGESGYFVLTVGVLTSVASGRPFEHPDAVPQARADRVVKASLDDGSLLSLQRALIDLDAVVPASSASRLS